MLVVTVVVVDDAELVPLGIRGVMERQFTAMSPNQLWLTDISEHPTGEDKLYLCAVKDRCITTIVGYSMSERMTASLAVDAVDNAIALRQLQRRVMTPLCPNVLQHYASVSLESTASRVLPDARRSGRAGNKRIECGWLL